MSRPVRTMEELASLVGLSRPTVSKYFNDPGSVRAATRSRIESAVTESGFRPNLHAVNLNRRRARLIGVVVPHALDPFYMALVRRIEQVATGRGYLAFVLGSDGRAELEERAVRTFASMNVAGTIVAPLGPRRRRSRLRDLKLDMPLVAIDSPLDAATAFVGTDNRRSVASMVEYLCGSGEPPAWFDMPAVNHNAAERREAYGAAMRACGHEPVHLPLEPSSTWEFERYGAEQAERLIGAGGLDAGTVLCANDRLAFGVLSAAWRRGLKVGRGEGCDLRVAGHDDHPLSAYACPPLTTVSQDHERIGQLATELLIERIGEPEPRSCAADRRVLLDATLAIRESA